MSTILEQLIQSKVKRKILRLFLFNTSKKFHTRELSRLLEEPISAIQRELKKMSSAQIIIKNPEGNTIKYYANTQNPFFNELKSLILKSSTEPKDMFKMLVKTKSLDTVMIYGDAVKKPMLFSSPIKLLVVGSLERNVLEEYLNATMEIFSRGYELLYFSSGEFVAAQNDKEIKQILSSPKASIFLKKDGQILI